MSRKERGRQRSRAGRPPREVSSLAQATERAHARQAGICAVANVVLCGRRRSVRLPLRAEAHECGKRHVLAATRHAHHLRRGEA